MSIACNPLIGHTANASFRKASCKPVRVVHASASLPSCLSARMRASKPNVGHQGIFLKHFGPKDPKDPTQAHLGPILPHGPP